MLSRATIPASDAEKSKRITVKIWSHDRIPCEIAQEIQKCQRVRVRISGINIAEALDEETKKLLEGSISSFEQSLSHMLRSLPSTTSAEQEIDNDNTIDQFLGEVTPIKTEQKRNSSHDSYEQQK